MLEPGGAFNLEGTFLGLGLESLEDVGVVVLQPGVLLGRGGDEAVLGVALKEIDLGGPAPCDLAFRHFPRPQPCGVNVTVTKRPEVTGRVFLVLTGLDELRLPVLAEDLLCDLAALLNGRWVVMSERVDDLRSDAASLVGERGVGREVCGELREGLKVVIQRSAGSVRDDQVGNNELGSALSTRICSQGRSSRPEVSKKPEGWTVRTTGGSIPQSFPVMPFTEASR